METSAKTGENINEAFEMVINEIYRVLKKNGEIEQSMNTSDPTGTYKPTSTQPHLANNEESKDSFKTSSSFNTQSTDPKNSKFLSDNTAVKLKASLHGSQSNSMVSQKKKNCKC